MKLNYNDWYEENQEELISEYDNLEDVDKDFFEFADFVIEKWDLYISDQQDIMQELGIDYYRDGLY